MLISQTMPDEHPPTPPPCRWSALITSPTLAKFQPAWRHLCEVVLFRSAYLFEHTLTAACALSKYQACRKYVYSNIFCDHLNVLYILDQTDLHRFEVKLELCGANARLAVSLPFPSPSTPPTPPPSRWPARTTLSSLAKFQLVWRRLCQALLSSFFLAGQKHPPLLSRLCLKCLIKLSIIFADTVDVLTVTFVV